MLRPALSPVALCVIAGWAVAGVIIATNTLIGWPPTSSLVLQVIGWEVVVLATGALLTLGGLLVLAASLPRVTLSTRWRLEGSGVWLLMGAWSAYALLSMLSGSVAVVAIIVGHIAAAVLRLRDIRREERITRAIVEGGK